MRLYSRKEFLDLPKGVIFCKGKPWCFESLMVKGETLTDGADVPIDFACRDLCLIEMGADSGEYFRRLDGMLSEGRRYPLETGYGRDGCFDDDEVFLVYEAADLKELRNVVDAACVSWERP